MYKMRHKNSVIGALSIQWINKQRYNGKIPIPNLTSATFAEIPRESAARPPVKKSRSISRRSIRFKRRPYSPPL